MYQCAEYACEVHKKAYEQAFEQLAEAVGFLFRENVMKHETILAGNIVNAHGVRGKQGFAAFNGCEKAEKA